MPNKENNQLDKQNKKVVKKFNEAEDVLGKMDIKAKLFGSDAPENPNNQNNIEGQQAEKQWVSDSLKQMEENDQKAKEEKKQRERSRDLNFQDAKERLRLHFNETVDISKGRLEIGMPLKTKLDLSYGKWFAERVSLTKRGKARNNKRSRLYRKGVVESKIRDGVVAVDDEHYMTCMLYAKEVKGKIKKEDFGDLCTFMTYADKSRNIDMLRLFMAGRDDEGNPQVDAYNARLAIVDMANQILGIKLDGIKLNTDSDIAENAERLERYARQVAAFDRISSRYKFLENIDNEKKEAIESKLTHLRPILSYYTIRKQILTDPEYITHYNDELTMDYSKARTDNQRRLCKLLIKSYIVGRNMLRINGQKVSSMKDPKFYDDEAREMFGNYVEDYEEAGQQQYIKDLGDNYLVADKNVDAAVEKNQEELNDEIALRELKSLDYVSKPLSRLLSSDELIPLKGTREMAALKKDIEAFSAFSTNTFPPVKLDANGKLDKKNEKKVQEEIDAVCTAAIMLYGKLSGSIDKFIKKYGSGYTELTEMLTELSKQVDEERESFRQKTIEYREAVSLDPELCKKPITILDTIRYNRGVFYDLDNDKKLTVEENKEGSDVVYKITRDVEKTEDNPEGKEVVYFKKQDNVPTADNQKFADELLQRHELTPELAEKMKTAITNMLDDNEKMRLFSNDYERYRDAKEENYAGTSHVIQSIFNEITNVDIKVSENEIKAFVETVKDFYNTAVKRAYAGERGAKIDNGKSLSDRSVATNRLATILGIQSMICDSRTASIRMNGKLIKGNIIENAEGEQTNLPLKRKMYSSNAIAQVFQMQVFDFICGQIDRRYSKFNGIVNESNKIEQIKCFGNELAFGKITSSMIDGKHYGFMVPVDDTGLRGLSAEFINKIMALDKPYLEQLLGDLLDNEEIDALVDRLNCVKNHVYKLAETDKNAKWDKKKKLFSFEGDIKDDELRRLYAIKEYQKMGGNFELICRFSKDNIDFTDIDSQIERRIDELHKLNTSAIVNSFQE